MPVLYQCDFCIKEPAEHNPDSPTALIVSGKEGEKDGSVICESCIDICNEIIAENKKKEEQIGCL